MWPLYIPSNSPCPLHTSSVCFVDHTSKWTKKEAVGRLVYNQSTVKQNTRTYMRSGGKNLDRLSPKPERWHDPWGHNIRATLSLRDPLVSAEEQTVCLMGVGVEQGGGKIYISDVRIEVSEYSEKKSLYLFLYSQNWCHKRDLPSWKWRHMAALAQWTQVKSSKSSWAIYWGQPWYITSYLKAQKKSILPPVPLSFSEVYLPLTFP